MLAVIVGGALAIPSVVILGRCVMHARRGLRNAKRTWLALAALLAGAVVAPAAASEATPDAAESAKRMDEVVVTATRREQEQRLVPASLYVIDGDSLEDRGDRSLADVAPTIPGLAHSGGGLGGASQVSILRGIGGNIEFSEDNPLVALYFGETPVTHAGGSGIDSNPRLELVDLDRIEVLRGPQGTYFGVSAMGGALRFLPRRPELGRPSARVAADLSSVANGSIGFGAQVAVNAPIDERSAVRVAGWGRHHAGYIDDVQRDEDDVNQGKTLGARLGYRFQPAEALTVDATLWTQYDRTEGDGFREYADPPLSQSRAIDEQHEERWLLGQVDMDYLGDRGRLVLNLAGFDRDYLQRSDISVFNQAVFGIDLPLTARNDNAVREYTQELRWIVGEDADLGGMLGLFHQSRDFHFDQDFPSPGITALIPEVADFGLGDSIAKLRTLTTLDQSAVYASGWWRLREDWELTAGLRAFRESRSFRAVNIGFFGNEPVALRASDSGLTPHLALRHAWSDDVQLYAAATRGFRGGRMTDPSGSQLPSCQAELAALGFDRFPIEVASDTLWNYELGGKFRLGGGAVFLNAAAYRIDWDDIQTMRILECAGIGLITNEGQARSQGLEVDLWAALGGAGRALGAAGLAFLYRCGVHLGAARWPARSRRAARFGFGDVDLRPGCARQLAGAALRSRRQVEPGVRRWPEHGDRRLRPDHARHRARFRRLAGCAAPAQRLRRKGAGRGCGPLPAQRGARGHAAHPRGQCRRCVLRVPPCIASIALWSPC